MRVIGGREKGCSPRTYHFIIVKLSKNRKQSISHCQIPPEVISIQVVHPFHIPTEVVEIRDYVEQVPIYQRTG